MSAVRHMVPPGAPRFSNRPSRRAMAFGAIGVAGAIAITAFVAILLTGIASQNASGSQLSAISTVQAKLCNALGNALNGKLVVKTLSHGYDEVTKNASCTEIDAHSNAVTLYQFVPDGAKANKTAYLANVKKDQALPGYGCSMSDQGQLDTSSENTIPGTKLGYGCNMPVGTDNIGTRVDALTTGGRSVSLSLACDPAVMRNWSAIMVALSAIGELAKTAA